jgi:lauroyl/myristoyl acyltransferase
MVEVSSPEKNEDLLGSRNGVTAWLQYFAARALLGGVSRLPFCLQKRLIGGLARVARRLDARHSNAARHYLQRALACGELEQVRSAGIEAYVLGSWRHFLQLTVDATAFDRRVGGAPLEHVIVEKCEGLDELLEGGSGGLLISPHLGDWEAGGAFLGHLGFDPLLAIAKPPRNRPLSRYILKIREKLHLTVLPRRGGMEIAKEGLRTGSWLLMLLDQRPRKSEVMAPFFGAQARTERSAGVLARRQRLPLVFFHCLKTEEPFHYRLRFTRVVSAEEVRSLTVEELATLANQEAEKAILGCPEQYFWLHDRFKAHP